MIVNCDRCAKAVDVPVTEEQYQRWRGGALIQRAMPNLTPAEREILMSGLCDDCFDEVTTNEPTPGDEDYEHQAGRAVDDD